MPIDLEKAVGAKLHAADYSWTEEDLILYNLGVGAGVPQDDPEELKYTYENDLVAVPAFGTIPPFETMMGLGMIEGIDIDLSRVLHGDQRLTIHERIPAAATVNQEGEVIAVHDKGRGALIVIEVVSRLEGSEDPLFTNRSGIYVRGEGGFGGDPGPGGSVPPPDREPDHLVESPTLPQQALLYRMASGDKNPLHADPAFASLAGFDRPILHGLCTFGIVAKAVVETALQHDPNRMHAYEARFSGHVFPGETLVTSIWEEPDSLLVETSTRERAKTVLSRGRVEVRA